MKLQINNLSKAYGDVKAIDNIDASFTNGIIGLLGPNGAGKSTLFNMLTTNMEPDSGEILLEGKNIFTLGEAYRQRIGYMPQQQAMYPDFTVGDFLMYMSALKGLPKDDALTETDRVLESVGLLHCKNKRISQLSGGMKQRILFAQALLGSPDILILDEPTAGLDPKQRVLMKKLLSEMAEAKIIIIATHIVSDVESIANQITIISDGHILLNDHINNCTTMTGGVTFTGLEDLYTHYFGIEDMLWE